MLSYYKKVEKETRNLPMNKCIRTFVFIMASSSCFCETSVTAPPPGTIQAKSSSYADVSAAIAKANSGDTVLVPAGPARWDKQLLITKAIKLIGAGIGSTNIIGEQPASEGSGYLIIYRPSSPNPSEIFRLSGFSFDMGNVTNRHFLGLFNATSTPVYVRIDHNSSTGTPKRCIEIQGIIYGVINNNTLSSGYYVLSVYGNNEQSWNNLTFSFGTSENIYFEDNTCTSKDVFQAGGAAGRYCARHNSYTFTNSSAGLFPWFDQHGNNGGAGQNLAGMGTEIYENTLVCTYNMNCEVLDHRGGKAVCYNNSVTTTAWAGVHVREEFIDTSNPPATASDGEPQHPSDSYYWNNTKNGIRIDPDINQTVDYGTGQIIAGVTYPPASPYRVVPQWNIDCWKQVDSFDGTTGMGVGPLANRPASGVLGVGYWATDVKTLYRWTTNNKWEEFYKPYTYPHPLRSIQ